MPPGQGKETKKMTSVAARFFLILVLQLVFIMAYGFDRVENDTHKSRSDVIAEHGMAAHDELLLYIVHGTLHLVGCDDQTVDARKAMRAHERAVMQQLGITLPGQTRGGKKQERTF